MIAVRLMGGLGNQLFQYAFGKSLALERGEDLCFFVAGKVRNDRLLDIASLNTDIKMVSKGTLNEIYRFAGDGLLFRLERHLAIELPFFSPKLLVEKELRYIEPSENYFFFDGYWQSFRYFQNYYDSFAHQLTPQADIQLDSDMLRMIRESESVAVHIRRGDYASAMRRNPHFCLGEEYYLLAVREFSKRLDNPVFYIFSDYGEGDNYNFDFLKEHKTINSSRNGNHGAVADLFLMSQCKHNIIANSSFSWWGAYLNRNSQKIVVAPSNWYRDWFKYNIDDLLPHKWIRIP